MEDVGLPPTGRQRFEGCLQNRVVIEPSLQFLRNRVLRRFLEFYLLPGFLDLNGLVDVVPQNRLNSLNLFEGGEFKVLRLNASVPGTAYLPMVIPTVQDSNAPLHEACVHFSVIVPVSKLSALAERRAFAFPGLLGR
jgi:hypothetical protein